MKQFENMTIAQLRKLTGQFERLNLENKKLKIKYPNKINQSLPTAEQVVEEVKRK